MAKAKDLAALAGLAGLAYAYNKYKNKDESTTDTGDETDRLKKRGTPEEGPRRKIEDYQKKAPEAEKGSAQSDVLKAVTAPKAASNDKAPNQGVLPQKSSTAVNPKPKRIGMTGAQNDALANAGKKSKAAAENTALAKVNRGMGREVTEAAKANAAPAPTIASKVGNIAKDTAVAAVKAANPVATAAYEFGTTPTSEQASANKFKHEMPISRFFKNVREAGNRGNPDVKMASGGMTASRRGDGIAQRGKTRGKMC